ncbi:DgyrCDS13004 [Dimorphilus gyrociliatus]|uniref:DgyrCDS13004 n=1 Tax=Dimorphilus gyrociliatus TaxID=2664684 RepID=A0A7I8W9C2_9ANNE|nr:DgyrCDS13004 [Dimorphilus gyrociliatus]
MVLKLLVSKDCGNLQMKSHQDHIKRVFESKKISFVEVDVGRPQTVKEKEKLLDMLLSPPQIFNGDINRGDYSTFLNALENEKLFEYLDINCPEEEVEYIYSQQMARGTD